jgi:ubiquinone/menaquinone biosynthesis C-methylase UbiE
MSEAQLFTSMTFPEIYERVLVAPLFRPFAEELIARAKLVPGDSVMDIACGTGVVARIAREALGAPARIAAVDVAPPMLAVARKADPTIDWREGSALSLPLGDGERFSVLTCHQGLQFFADKAVAVHEMRRALAPAGRVAIACWRALQDLPAAREFNDVAERRVGKIVDLRHSFGDPDALRELLAQGGFQDIRVGTFSHDVLFSDGALYARLNAMAVIGMTEKGKTMNEAERSEMAARIGADSQQIVDRRTANGTFVFPLETNIAVARV